jgi:hypothetical protein
LAPLSSPLTPHRVRGPHLPRHFLFLPFIHHVILFFLVFLLLLLLFLFFFLVVVFRIARQPDGRE